MSQALIKPLKRQPAWRIAGWALLLLLLLMPAMAMRFTTEVNWTASDSVIAGVMFLVLGCAIELIVHFVRGRRTRALVILAVLGGFLWLWAELAVGVFTNWGS